MERRNFLAASAACGLTASLLHPLRSLGAEAERNGIGLQLYTLRNQMANDIPGTLKAVADAGYKQVELMAVMGSDEIVATAKGLGLEIRSAFFNWETIANPTNPEAPTIEAVIEKAKEIGLEYLVFGYIGKSQRDRADKMRKIADRANEAAEKIAKAGMKMSYHNHSFEFEKIEGETTSFEILMERFDEKLVNFEFDVFWAAIGGWDPIKTINKLGSRIGQIHLKDLKADSGVVYDEGKVPADAFQEVGDGTINMKRVIKIAAKHGVTQFHVEQDQSPDPIASIGQSINYTKKIW